MAKKKPFPRPSHPARSAAVGTIATGPDWQNIVICVFLVAAVFAVFGQTAHFEFVNYDDDENVYANQVVSRGLTWSSLGWAFSHPQVFNWIPLTTLSHMLDCSLFGTNAGGPHLVNVALHAASAVLLFLVLGRMTGRRWCSAFVAAVFALHPLRAESVAWVSERKDVLSAFFFMLTLWAYVRNLRRPSWPGRLAVMLFFALGLLSKSMVVTLPVVLLLLDYWPLGRWRPAPAASPAGRGKTPAVCPRRRRVCGGGGTGIDDRFPACPVLGSSGHRPRCGGDISVANGVPGRAGGWLSRRPAGLGDRVGVGPVGGPHRGRFDRLENPALFARGLALVPGHVAPGLRDRANRQYVAHADRYTYLPGIGLVLGGTWAVAGWSAGWRHQRPVAGGLMVVILAALIFAGHRQTAFWRDSQTLWKHALACTTGNVVVRNNLGNAFATQNRPDDAITQYRLALALKPDYAECHFNLGNLFNQQGRFDEAIGEYQLALAIEPRYVAARLNLGNALSALGRAADALAQYRQAVEINPDGAEARYDLAVELARQGRVDEAVAQYRKVIAINPDYTAARKVLGVVLLQQGDAEGAIAQYRRVLALNPADAEAHNNLGVALLSRTRVDEAVAQFRRPRPPARLFHRHRQPRQSPVATG